MSILFDGLIAHPHCWSSARCAVHSYETVLKRWPIILTGIIDHLHKANHNLSIKAQSESKEGSSRSSLEEKTAEGTAIIHQISKLKYEMARDRPLECVDSQGLSVTLTEPAAQLLGRSLTTGSLLWSSIIQSW